VKTAEPAIAKVAAELGLRSDAVKGKLPQNTRPIGRARIGLYKPWVESIDEGWTRWVLEQYEFPFTTLADADIRAANLNARFDVIILPNLPADRLTSGYSADVVPIEYSGGLGSGGVEALRAFVRAGGTLICLGQSSGFAISTFELPVRDVTRDKDEQLFCPGSILRLDVDVTQPLGYGMEPHTAAFFAFSSAFEAAVPRNAAEGNRADTAAAPGVETVASYGKDDLLLSGWLEGEDVIAGRAAALRATAGSGHVVLFGFPVQHRGQSHATFRLLFNAILSGR
jgi:hypothetical protein